MGNIGYRLPIALFVDELNRWVIIPIFVMMSLSLQSHWSYYPRDKVLGPGTPRTRNFAGSQRFCVALLAAGCELRVHSSDF